MRRWTILLAGAALWLFLAALPVLADGGPHVASVNNGTGAAGLTADSCAGCHRAHTGSGEFLLTEDNQTQLCLTCHGAGSTGATTNVVNGVQFVPSTNNPLFRNASGNILGALRDGGFVTAAIGSDKAYKWQRALPYSSHAKIPVKVDSSGNIAGQAVTSAHMSVPGTGLTGFTGKTWGNLTQTPGDNAGATGGTMECGSCHNPHGNGAYRILQKQPAVSGGDFAMVAAPGVTVGDAALPPLTDTRNYTIIQTIGGTGTLLAGQVAAVNTAGDYLRRAVPWNGYGAGATADAPNGDPTNFNTQINAWCVTCHTRYLSGGGTDTTSQNAIFHNRHFSSGAAHGGVPVCTTCHVAHGSNAQMTANGYSAGVNFPDGSTKDGDSRLLKADNRGICQTCHDPTHTLTAGQYVGPVPNPIVP